MNSYMFMGIDDVEEGEEISSRKKSFIKRPLPQYVKRDHGSNPFILLEAVASQDLWIWHAFFGVSGSNNDINVLYQSPLFNDLKTGRAPKIPFVANGGGIHVECGRMLSDRGLQAFVRLAAMAVIPNVSRTPSFVIILVGPAVAGQGWLGTLCWCFVNAWLALCYPPQQGYSPQGYPRQQGYPPEGIPPLAILLASEVNARKQHLATEIDTL
nr:reverse transcriptase domain-containing protein [Tanacetum cinerariifolium]